MISHAKGAMALETPRMARNFTNFVGNFMKESILDGAPKGPKGNPVTALTVTCLL